jgi:two-component system, cell cycle sensor histidine kinase and response regulator CckA
MLNIEMIALTGSLTATQQKHLKQAQDSAHVAHRTTQQLVTFARGGGAVRKVIDPKDLLIETLHRTLEGSTSSGLHSLPPDLWPVEVDEAEFAQVLRNLVLNAREAMAAGGLVRVSAENVVLDVGQEFGLVPGRYIRIVVTDEGPGVPPEIAAKVFDPYFSTKHRGVQKGMGLGLTICHSILQRHGGAVTMSSERGRGASFRCYWPASSLSPAPRDPFTIGSGQVRPLKVLVMDDEESVREVLAQMLAQFGHIAEVAPSGEAAIAAYRSARASKTPFDVALLDLSVKAGMGGAETLGQIRREDPTVTAVLMTAHTEETHLPHYKELGFRATLTKPFHVDHLRLVLEHLAELEAADSSDTK